MAIARSAEFVVDTPFTPAIIATAIFTLIVLLRWSTQTVQSSGEAAMSAGGGMATTTGTEELARVCGAVLLPGRGVNVVLHGR